MNSEASVWVVVVAILNMIKAYLGNGLDSLGGGIPLAVVDREVLVYVDRVE